MPRPIDSVELFYAHALAIEREAVERYDEFRAYFRGRGEDVLASLCEQVACEEREHYERLLRATRHMTLPEIDARKYQWFDSGSPESPSREVFYRVSTPRQLLEVALAGEIAARRFFRWCTRTTRDPAVRALSRGFAHDEAAHVRWFMDALQYREPSLDWEKMVAHGLVPGAAAQG